MVGKSTWATAPPALRVSDKATNRNSGISSGGCEWISDKRRREPRLSMNLGGACSEIGDRGADQRPRWTLYWPGGDQPAVRVSAVIDHDRPSSD